MKHMMRLIATYDTAIGWAYAFECQNCWLGYFITRYAFWKGAGYRITPTSEVGACTPRQR